MKIKYYYISLNRFIVCRLVTVIIYGFLLIPTTIFAFTINIDLIGEEL